MSRLSVYMVDQGTCTKRDKDIKIQVLLFGAKECTQMKVADRLGISRSYVSRIEKKALGNLREVLIERETDMII